MRPTRPTHHYLPCPRFPLPLQDSKLKTWAWENDVLCAYKDDQLQPIPITKARTRVDWADAQTCTGAPNATTSARDKLNRLWGWERQRCACARARGGQGPAMGLPRACAACMHSMLPACMAHVHPAHQRPSPHLHTTRQQLRLQGRRWQPAVLPRLRRPALRAAGPPAVALALAAARADPASGARGAAQARHIPGAGGLTRAARGAACGLAHTNVARADARGLARAARVPRDCAAQARGTCSARGA